MNNTSENSKLVNKQKKLYVFCSNISRWVPKKYLTNARGSAYEFSVKGVIMYKFVGKCHLPPNCFRFIEFYHDENKQTALLAASKSNLDLECEIRSLTITKPKIIKITRPALIDKLNDDCLIVIFLYLPMEKRLEMEKVCTRWRDVSQRAWMDIRELVFSPYKFASRHNPKLFEDLLIKCGAYLNKLEFHNLKLSCNAKYYDVFPKMEKLQSFGLKEVDSRFFSYYLLSLPKTVRCIGIRFPPHSGSDILPTSIAYIIKRFNALESLTIKTYDLGGEIIEAISEMETITKLNLTRCKFYEFLTLNLLTNLNNLEYLDVSGFDTVNHDFLECLSTKCKKLKHLDVSYCEALCDEGINKLKNLDNLEVLVIHDMRSEVTDRSLGQLKGMKRLDCENCLGVKDDGIMQLIINSPNLEELNVSGTSITEETLRLAICVTKDRKNSVTLYFIASLREEIIERNENYSPFFKYNETKSNSEDESSIIDNEYGF